MLDVRLRIATLVLRFGLLARLLISAASDVDFTASFLRLQQYSVKVCGDSNTNRQGDAMITEAELKKLIKESRLSVREIARRSGLHSNTLYLFLKGEISISLANANAVYKVVVEASNG